jgi:hypothetical protein
MRLLLVRVKARRIECEAGAPDTFALFDRASGLGTRGADGHPGASARATVDASGWRLEHADHERWHAPAPESCSEEFAP